MTDHTPGPWIATERDPITWDVSSPDCGGIVTVHDYPHNADRIEPDARLISAAPELLAALEGMFNGTCFCDFPKGGFTHHGRHCDEARAAIAKARGGAL